MKLPPRVSKILRRTGLGVLITLFVLLLAGATWTVVAVRGSFPQHDGDLTLKGLSAPVTVHRDRYGIPQLYAKTEADLLKAQGYVHAQDRFWEMDFRRHVTAGRVAEIFGESQLKTDIYLRTMGWRKVAEREWEIIAPETKAALEAYTAGVNAWLDENPGGDSLEYKILSLQNPGYKIEKWHPVDSLSWLKAMAWDLRGNMQEETRRAALLGVGLSQKQVDDLYPPYPYDRNVPIVGPGGAALTLASSQTPLAVDLTSLERDLTALPGLMGNDDGDRIGSNSWVIHGTKTGSGKPILANDPHLSPSQPGIWYQMGLHCECGTLDAAGFSFAGVPGVIIGHNARIAWGFTNLGPDVIDLYLERLDAGTEVTSRQEKVKVAGGDEVTITIRSTKHGPLVSDASEDLRKILPNQAVALRWTALDAGRTADAIFKLNKASNWQDFRAAAALFEVPAQNMIYADVDGNIGYQAPGKIPVRGKGDGRYMAPGWDGAFDWTGYIPFEEMPSSFNPPQGYIVTANQAVIGPQYPRLLTSDWSYGYRSQRINEMIVTTRGRLTVDDVQTMQFDSRNGFAQTLIPVLQQLKRPPLSQVESDADALLKSWKFEQTDDSAAAAYYNAIWRHLMLRTFEELTPANAPNGGDRWFEVVRRLLEQPDNAWWDDTTTVAVERRDDTLARAVADAVKELSDLLGENPKEWTWGELHTLTPTHATFGSSGIGPLEWLFNGPEVATGGGTSIVNANGWHAGRSYEVDAVPSMRMIVDLNNVNESRWIQLTGNSGHAFHDNYDDQLELWRTGQTIPFRFEKATIEREKVRTLTLRP
ncbi:MAG TPA: penicillin acylase family protein [Candidatus Limnocylindrales bacterium]